MRRLTLFLLSSIYSLAVLAQQPAVEFSQCLQTIQQQAQQQGVSAKTLQSSLLGANYVLRVIELDRAQPEFTTTFADYINRRVTPERIELGRKYYQQHRKMLEQVTAKYGIPAQYLVAFWGLETNFGRYFGKMPIIDSLATLACDERRSEYFTFELISALKIIDEGAIAADKMQGSWAGAMGHVQFMPHVFLKYAVDGDGDGKRDLWHSLPDAMFSAGNFLQGIGWQREQRWGREVNLPANFDYAHIGYQAKRSLAQWRELGVTMAANGKAIEALPLEAVLLVPAGHNGPKFLVYENFNVIMRWNRSEYYALAVGYLADQIAGGNAWQNPPPSDALRFNREQMMGIQQALNDKGFDVGTIDGIWGPATRKQVRAFQQAQKMIADGFIDTPLLQALQVK